MAIGIGIIGMGTIGQFHMARLARGIGSAKIVGVSGRDVERAARTAKPYGDVIVFSAPEELINDDRIDAIMVTSAGFTHEEYVLAAIAAGKPVFCEKPLATTIEGCRNIVDAEVKFGRRLVQVGFMRRFDPAYRALKSALQSGAVGAPLFFHSVHRNSATGDRFQPAMIFNDASVHDIDIARWLLEDEVANVSVVFPRRNSRAPNGLRDPVMVLLEMESGTIVDAEISANIGFGYDIRGEISGESGVISLAESNHLIWKSDGAFRGAVNSDWRERFDAAFEIELREWVVAATNGTATGPSSWDGYVATIVADTALRAADQGRLPVSIPPRPALYASEDR